MRKRKKRALIVSGVSAAGINRTLAKRAEEYIEGLTVGVLAVRNDFFGETVTCTGLLTGRDMLAALRDYLPKTPVDEVIIAGNTMKEFEDVFLCGMRLEEFTQGVRALDATVTVNRDGGEGLAQIFTDDR